MLAKTRKTSATRIGTVLRIILLLCLAMTLPACLNINKSPDVEPAKEVNVGGEHGLTVEH
ncbi:MAG: hypothetical protein GVY16_04145 [Planctomycetes bacterium]|jgi:hypothetical protein|nr:hypothetical protein [Planctomycetota bacterium]